MESFADKFIRIKSRIGLVGMVEVLLHFVILPVYAGWAWFHSLLASRVLLVGKWSEYMSFHPANSLNEFFYRIQWLNLKRHGRIGVSSTMGLGHYSMSRWFHISRISSCLYSAAGSVVTLLGTLSWVFFNLIWIDQADIFLVSTVVAALFLSSTSYSMAFAKQNYNILGWMWAPIAVYATINGQSFLAAIIWLVASMMSVTSIFLMLPMMMAYSMSEGAFAPIIAMIPAGIKCSFHFIPFVEKDNKNYVKNASKALASVGKLIGAINTGTRYKYQGKLSLSNLYFIALYSIGVMLLYIDGDKMPLLPLMALAIFIVNQLAVRVADIQSVIVLYVTYYAGYILSGNGSALSMLGLILVANPLPVYLGLCDPRIDKSLVRFLPRRPFDHGKLQMAISDFLKDVPKSARVYLAFEDPGDDFSKVFDGYQTIMQLPIYIANMKEFHLIPDWWAVEDTNFLGAPCVWGRRIETVGANMEYWGADFVVIYQDTDTALDPAWINTGYHKVAEFDWGNWLAELGNSIPWTANKAPKWWLLRRDLAPLTRIP